MTDAADSESATDAHWTARAQHGRAWIDHCRAVLRHEAEPLELDVTTEMMREKTT